MTDKEKLDQIRELLEETPVYDPQLNLLSFQVGSALNELIDSIEDILK
jgi:hypothetical protein